jgi:hypothetical protein
VQSALIDEYIKSLLHVLSLLRVPFAENEVTTPATVRAARQRGWWYERQKPMRQQNIKFSSLIKLHNQIILCFFLLPVTIYPLHCSIMHSVVD